MQSCSVSETQKFGQKQLLKLSPLLFLRHLLHLRVHDGRRVLGLLDEPGHVLQEEVVHALLVHLAQLQASGGVAVGDGVAGVVAVHLGSSGQERLLEITVCFLLCT